jgi:hypothetical protein
MARKNSMLHIQQQSITAAAADQRLFFSLFFSFNHLSYLKILVLFFVIPPHHQGRLLIFSDVDNHSLSFKLLSDDSANIRRD